MEEELKHYGREVEEPKLFVFTLEILDKRSRNEAVLRSDRDRILLEGISVNT